MNNQENGKAKENKREDKKALKKLWIILAGSMLLGMVLGILSSFLGESSIGLYDEGAKWILKQVGIFGTFIVTTALLAAIAVIYRKAKKLYLSWDGEEEELYNRIELKLSYAIMLTHIGMICGYFFFTFGVYVTELNKIAAETVKLQIWEFWVVLCGMVYAVAAMCIAQQKVVNLEKVLNPEKKGSVYDVKFDDKWMETCDEAERAAVYRCAYGAFRMMQKAFPVAWIITLLGMMTFETGMLPVIMVLALWMVMVCTYCVNSIYYTKHPSKVMK